MADDVDDAINSFCPEPDTCPFRSTGLDTHCYECCKILKQKISDYDGILVQDRFEKIPMTDSEVETPPAEEGSSEINSEEFEGISLYLISQVIKDQIQKKRESVAGIDVRPGTGHFFTITVKTAERRIYRPSIARKQAVEIGGERDE